MLFLRGCESQNRSRSIGPNIAGYNGRQEHEYVLNREQLLGRDWRPQLFACESEEIFWRRRAMGKVEVLQLYHWGPGPRIYISNSENADRVVLHSFESPSVAFRWFQALYINNQLNTRLIWCWNSISSWSKPDSNAIQAFLSKFASVFLVRALAVWDITWLLILNLHSIFFGWHGNFDTLPLPKKTAPAQTWSFTILLLKVPKIYYEKTPASSKRSWEEFLLVEIESNRNEFRFWVCSRFFFATN